MGMTGLVGMAVTVGVSVVMGMLMRMAVVMRVIMVMVVIVGMRMMMRMFVIVTHRLTPCKKVSSTTGSGRCWLTGRQLLKALISMPL